MKERIEKIILPDNLPLDKRKHFIVGFWLSLLGLVWMPLILTGYIAGTLKEVYDFFNQHKHTPELKDMFYTWYGSSISSGICVVLYVCL
jgi:hypothetical protein